MIIQLSQYLIIRDNLQTIIVNCISRIYILFRDYIYYIRITHFLFRNFIKQISHSLYIFRDYIIYSFHAEII